MCAVCLGVGAVCDAGPRVGTACSPNQTGQVPCVVQLLDLQEWAPCVAHILRPCTQTQGQCFEGRGVLQVLGFTGQIWPAVYVFDTPGISNDKL